MSFLVEKAIASNQACRPSLLLLKAKAARFKFLYTIRLMRWVMYNSCIRLVNNILTIRARLNLNLACNLKGVSFKRGSFELHLKPQTK